MMVMSISNICYRQAVKAGLSTSFYQVAIKTKKNVKVAIVQVTMFFLE